jgi:predicted Zn-dependent protease
VRQADSFALIDSVMPLRVRLHLARIALARGQLDVCERHARAVLAVRPAFGPALLTLAEALLARGDLAGFHAIAASIAASPETPTAQALLAAMLATHEGDPAGALCVVDAALARDPNSFFLRKARATTLLAAGRSEARAAISDQLRSAPLDLEATAAWRRFPHAPYASMGHARSS